MANGIYPSSSNTIPSSSVEKTSSFGWMDTALFVGGTLFCGAWFGPACGLVYALTYLAGKEIDNSFSPPPSLKEKQVLPVEQPNTETKKTSAAASQILAPTVSKLIPSQPREEGSTVLKQKTKNIPEQQKEIVPAKDTNLLEKTSDASQIQKPISVSPQSQTMAAPNLSSAELERAPAASQTQKPISVPSPSQTMAAPNLGSAALERAPAVSQTQKPISVPSPSQTMAAPNLGSAALERAPAVSQTQKPISVPPQSQTMAAPNLGSAALERAPAASQIQKPISVPLPSEGTAVPIKDSIPSIMQKTASGQPLNTASIPQVPHKSVPTQVFPLKGGGQQTVSKIQVKQTNWLKSFFTPRIPGGPPGIPNRGNSCFAASVFHLIADHSIFNNHLVGILKDGPKAFFQKWLPIYQKEKTKGTAQSSIPINEMRRFLPGSGGRIQGYAQEDAESLMRGVFGPVSIQIDSCPFISLETLQQQHKDLLKNPLLRIKTERKTWFVGDASLEGTDFVRYESNPQYAYSMKRSIEVPILNVNFLMDEKGQMVNLPLPLLLEQNYFISKSTLYDEPYKLKNGRLALLQSTQITFDKPPAALIIALSRFKDGQKIKTPVETPLNLTLPSNGTENRATAEYELAGTVIHDGEFNAGHYIAEGVSFDSKGQPRIWHSDDSRVNPITVKDFENNAAHAYLQLYVQKTAKNN